MGNLAIAVSLRHLWRRKGRTFLTVWGISLGVSMVMAIAIVNNSILASFYQLIDQVSGKASLQVIASADSGFDAGMLEQARKADGVGASSPIVRRNTYARHGANEAQLLIYGIDMDTDRHVRDYKLAEGHALSTGDVAEILLTKPMAERLAVSTGDELQLLTVQGLVNFRVVGLLDQSGPAKINGGRFAVIPLRQAQNSFAREGKLDVIDLVLDHNAKPAQVKDQLSKQLGDTVLVVPPAERGKEVDEMLASLRQMLLLASVLSLVVGAFVVYNNVSVSVQERRHEFSILRCIGAEGTQVRRLIIVESGLLGLGGSLLGIVVGIGLAQAMSTGVSDTLLAMYRFNITGLPITLTHVFGALVAGTGTALVVAWPASRELLRLKAVEAARPHGQVERPAAARWSTLGLFLFTAGLALTGIALVWRRQLDQNALPMGGGGFFALAVGVVLLAPGAVANLGRVLAGWFGRRGLALCQLGAQNLTRRPTRVGATICALAVAVSMLVGMGGMIKSFKTSITDWTARAMGWDLMVSSSFAGMSADVTLPESVGTELKGLRGVAVASPERFTMINLDDKPAYLAVFDMSLFPKYGTLDVIDGDADHLYANMAAGQVAINSSLARQRNLRVGGTIRFTTPSGPVEARVTAVLNTLFSAIGAVYMDRGFYVNHWHDTTADTYVLKLDSGAALDDVARTIQDKWQTSRHLTVQTSKAYRKQIDDMVAQSMALVDALLYIAVMVGALGVTNTLFISIIERKRELALLRAVGSNRFQVGLIVISEAAIIGVVAGAFGTAIGALLALVLIQNIELSSGMVLEHFVPTSSIAIGLALSLILTPVAGLLPAWMAAKLPITMAIRQD